MNADAFIERIATGLMLLAVIATFTLSSSVLTNWKIHYLTAGGNFYEKLHPATYFTLLAFSLLLMRSRGPVGEINRMFSESKLLLVYLLCWLFLLIQMFVLERPFTVIIDTFLLPILIALVMWRLSPAQKRPLVWAIHLTILLNVVLGYYEYFSGHRLIPLTLGDVVVMGEWRSAALLGHPLTASGVVGAYVLALVLRPAICPPLAGAAAADRILPRIADGLRRPNVAGYGAGGDRAARAIRGDPPDARQANAASGRDPRHLRAVCCGRHHLRRARPRHFRQDAAALLFRQGQRAGALRHLQPALAFRLA